MLSRLTVVPVKSLTQVASQALKPQSSQRLTCLLCQSRTYASQSGRTLRGRLRNPTLKEQVLAPAGETGIFSERDTALYHFFL